MERERPLRKEPIKATYYDIYVPNSIDGGYGHDLYKTIDDIIEHDTITPIRFKIDTYGGALSDCLEVARLIEQVPNPVSTYAGTKCDSGGILLVACGDKGARFAHHNTEFIAHQVQWNFSFKGSNPELIRFMKARFQKNREFIDAIAAKSGTPRAEWLRLTEQDYAFGAERAVELGIIDNIIYPKKPNGKK